MVNGFADQVAAIKRKPPMITPEDVPGFVRNGVLSINEVRQQMGLKPITGGDVHFIATDIAVICVSDLIEVDEGSEVVSIDD